MEKEIRIDIYWEDLTKEAQERVKQKLGISDPREGNWDIIPFDVLLFYKDEES